MYDTIFDISETNRERLDLLKAWLDAHSDGPEWTDTEALSWALCYTADALDVYGNNKR